MADIKEHIMTLLQHDSCSGLRLHIPQQQRLELMTQCQQLFEQAENLNSLMLRRILKSKYIYLKAAVESGRVEFICRAVKYVLGVVDAG
jgi:hypothetical protein